MPENNKYHINDEKGTNAFLKSIKPKEDKEEKNSAFQPEVNKRKYIRNAIIVIVLAIAILVSLSFFAYNLVQKFRSKEVSIHEVMHRSIEFEKRMKKDISTMETFEESMTKADEILSDIDELIKKYPEEDTLKFLWSNVLMHKYEKYMHYSLKSEMFQNLASLDSVDLMRVKEYNPEFLAVFKIIQNIPEFYRYKKKYPVPPSLATVAPPEWQVKKLIDLSSAIEDSIKKHPVLIEVHFPVLNTWLKYAFNYVVPDLYVWQTFWKKYKDAIQDHDSYSNEDDAFTLLGSAFPNLQFLKTSSAIDLFAISDFSIGIPSDAIVQVRSSIMQEWQPIIIYFKEQYKYNVNLRVFQSENELMSAFIDGKVDFVLLDIPTSTYAFYSKTGIPIVIRAWNGKNYIENYLVSVKNSIKKWQDVQNGTLGFFSSDFFYLYEFYEKHKVKIDSLQLQPKSVKSLDKLISGINQGAFDAISITEEEMYYLNASGSLKRNLNKLVSLDPAPQGVIWARDGLPTGFVKKVQSIFLSMVPQAVYLNNVDNLKRPYASWDSYEEPIMKKYFHDIRNISLKYNILINKLHIINNEDLSDTTVNKISDALTRYLEREGFAVVNHEASGNVEIKPNEQVLSFNVDKADGNKHKYTIKVHKAGSEDSIIYHDQFLVDKNDIPDFRNKLFDLAHHLTVTGKVVEIGTSQISISTSVNTKMLEGKEIRLYRKKYLDDKSVKSYGIGKIKKIHKHMLIVDVDKETLRHVRNGDIGVIIN